MHKISPHEWMEDEPQYKHLTLQNVNRVISELSKKGRCFFHKNYIHPRWGPTKEFIVKDTRGYFNIIRIGESYAGWVTVEGLSQDFFPIAHRRYRFGSMKIHSISRL